MEWSGLVGPPGKPGLTTAPDAPAGPSRHSLEANRRSMEAPGVQTPPCRIVQGRQNPTAETFAGMHRFGEPPPSPSCRFPCLDCTITPAAARPLPQLAPGDSSSFLNAARSRAIFPFGIVTQTCAGYLIQAPHPRSSLGRTRLAPGRLCSCVAATTHSPHPHPPLPYCRDQ